jgi:hypothetical protein
MADDAAVRITIGAELDDSLTDAVEAAKAQLGALEQFATEAMSNAARAPEQHGSRQGSDQRVEQARREADELARIHEQSELKWIDAERQANNFALAQGQESLDQWKAQAVELENARDQAARDALKSREAADAGNASARAKDFAQEESLDQEHTIRLSAIEQQYQTKKRQLQEDSFQLFLKQENDALAETTAKLEAEYKAHEISAQERRDAEVGLTQAIEQEVLKRYNAEHAGLVAGNKAFADAEKERQQLLDSFNHHVQTADAQLASEETQKWLQLGNSIKSSFNSALDGLIFQGKSFQQFMLQVAEGILKAFLGMGENMLENWIETQIAQEFATKTTQTATAVGQITDNAAVAAAGAYAATAAIPVVGPELAPAAAASAFGGAMSWAGSLVSFDVGAWEVSRDMVANIHQGEMVVPRDFASGLRSHGGGLGAGGDVNMHYAPTIHAREPSTLAEMLTRESSEMLSWLNRQFRNGVIAPC